MTNEANPICAPQSKLQEAPLVTVVLTVFKRTQYLEAAIASVLGQTFAALEVLVTDDANQPQTRAICEKFVADGRVRYRANPKTLGAPLNIAAALRESRGKYICILNDDDLLEPQMLERLVAPLEQFPEVVLAFGNYRIMDQAGRELAPETPQGMRARRWAGLASGIIEPAFDFALRRGVMVAFGCLFRKDVCATDWLVPKIAGAYDYWLALNLGRKGAFYFVPETVMSWREHADSVSAAVSPEKHAGEMYILSTLSATGLDLQQRRFVEDTLAHLLFLQGLEYLQHGWCTRVARSLLWQSLKLRWRFAALRYWLATLMPNALRQLSLRLWRSVKSSARCATRVGI